MSKHIIKVRDVGKSFDPKIVFERISFVINRGERIALVGANGCGKSTLARILAGVGNPDEGTVEANDSTTVAYLPQEITLGDKGFWTIREYIENSLSSIDSLRKELQKLEEIMSDGGAGEEVLLKYGELQEIFEARENVYTSL